MSGQIDLGLECLPPAQRSRRTAISTSKPSSSETTRPISSRPSLEQSSTNSIDQEPTQEELDQKPWKYIGYQGYTTFLTSDIDFCNFRRFDRLNIRVILALQDELTQIEEEIDNIDRACSRREAADVNNGSFRQDTQRERVDMIWEARRKLEDYNRFVYHYIKLKTRSSATEKDITSLRNWFHNHNGAILREEQTYIEKDDLFALIPKERSLLRRILERSPHFRLSRLWQKPTSADLPFFHGQQDHIHYFSDKRIDRFVTLTILLTGLVMLIAPIWILAFTYAVVLKLTVITIFILLFLGLVVLGTNAKAYETLAATAAYSAILMVFLQLGSGASPD